MSIRIVVDSTSDLTDEIINKYNIKMMPLTVNFEDKSYKDKIELSSSEFFVKMSKSDKLPKTSQVTPGDFIEAFNEILAQGDEILGIFIASQLSGTYSAANIAKETIGSDKIHIIDSQSVCLGAFSLILRAIELVEQKKNITEIVDAIEKEKANIVAAFALDSLKNLEKGGRLSKGQAVVGTLLNIKPILEIKDGKIQVIDKVRGKNKTNEWFDQWIEKNGYDLSDKTVLFFHGNAPEKLKSLREAIESKYSVKQIIEQEVGAVIGTHTGPGVVAMSFLNI